MFYFISVKAASSSSSSSSSSLLPSPPSAMHYTGPSSSFCYPKNKFMIVIARAKKKNKSKSPGSHSNPPRITSNVKQNLQILKLSKDSRERRSWNPHSSYRRKKLSKEVLPEDEDTEPYQDPDLDFTGEEDGDPVLLVDGYNVCGYWPKLQKPFFEGRLDVAREHLIDDLLTFGRIRGMQVVVVFDAMQSGLPTRRESFFCVDIVYSGSMPADTWIEEEVVALRENGCPKVWVATSDRLQQDAACAAGASVWSCRTLVSEIEEALEEEAEMRLQEERPHHFEGSLPKRNLNTGLVEALMDLRSKLVQNERKKLAQKKKLDQNESK